MNYIVFDLEFNQGFNSRKTGNTPTRPECPFEIIQIGALKLDENLKTIGSLNRLVKPVLYTNINPYVKEMTGITSEMLCKAKSFKEVYLELVELINEESTILCVWGTADIKELFRNAEYHNLDTAVLPKQYVNVQHYASVFFNSPRGINIGLQNAVELLEIPLQNEFHDAFNDACYTAEVFKKVYNDSIRPKVYIHDKYRNLAKNNIRKKIDHQKLILQFEKMFSRQITEDEKSMIKLAYIMGKTNQFQSDEDS